MKDTNNLRTGAGYALEVGLYATHKAMTEAADTIDTLRTQLAEAQRDAEQLRKAARDAVYRLQTSARIWDGTGWVHNPIRAELYLKVRDNLRAAIDASKEDRMSNTNQKDTND